MVRTAAILCGARAWHESRRRGAGVLLKNPTKTRPMGIIGRALAWQKQRGALSGRRDSLLLSSACLLEKNWRQLDKKARHEGRYNLRGGQVSHGRRFYFPRASEAKTEKHVGARPDVRRAPCETGLSIDSGTVFLLIRTTSRDR